MRTSVQLLGVKIIVAVGLVLAPAGVEAYVGPGAGLSAIGSLLAFAAAVIVAMLGFVWFPLKRLLRKVRGSVAVVNGSTGVRTTVDAEHDHLDSTR